MSSVIFIDPCCPRSFLTPNKPYCGSRDLFLSHLTPPVCLDVALFFCHKSSHRAASGFYFHTYISQTHMRIPDVLLSSHSGGKASGFSSHNSAVAE